MTARAAAERRSLVLWSSVLSAAAAGAATASLHPGALALVGGLVASLGALAVSTAHPPMLLHLVVVAAASGAVLRQLEGFAVGGEVVTLSGLRWLAAGGAAVVVAMVRRLRLPLRYSLLPYAAFVLWMGARCAVAERPLRGLEDVVIYAVPWVIALFADAALREARRPTIRHLETTLLASVALPVLLYAVALSAGWERITVHGPKGLVGSRPVALLMLVVLAMAIGVLCYERAAARRWGALVSAAVAVGLILFTGSRAAAIVAVLLLATAGVDPRRLGSVGRRLALGLVLALALVVTLPSLAARMFHFAPASAAEAVEGFNVSGRDRMWTAVFERARQRPLVGWGPASARPVVADALRWKNKEVPPREYPPHNEYLQVLHDGGAVGLVLLLLAAGLLAGRHLHAWRVLHGRGDPVAARWSYAAFASLGMVFLTATIDNTLHYFVVICPAMAVAGCASRLAAEAWRTESDSGTAA